jgi:hypothetical protein
MTTRCQMLARWDEMIEQAHFRCWHKADVTVVVTNVSF